jgi:hypothetical protein
VNERSSAAKVLSDEKCREWYAERHARRLRDNARCRLFRIVGSIRKLALTPIPQFDSLDELLPPRDRAAITKNSPKAFANLEACEEVISASVRESRDC